MISFDAIIIGAGMGGAAAGYVMANAGMKVMFLERGLPKHEWDTNFSGNYAEVFLDENSKNRINVYKKSGRATYKVNSWIPVLGSGEGGSTGVYGSLLFAPHPEDLKTWPENSYHNLEPYFKRCYEILAPLGEKDPLFPRDEFVFSSRPATKTESKLKDVLAKKGLHPYSTPLGISKNSQCKNCFGFYCTSTCKKTASVFLDQIKSYPNVFFKYSTQVERMITDGERVTGVSCITKNGREEFKASYVFLAAGALMTPVILSNSKGPYFPRGLGNEHDLVGRFLMRHLIDFYFIKTFSEKQKVNHNDLACLSFSDFYRRNGVNFGTINSTRGVMPPEQIALEFSKKFSVRSQFIFLTPFIRELAKIYLRTITKNRILLAPIIPDSADFENRIMPDSTIEEVKLRYKITNADKIVLKKSRRVIKKRLKGHSLRLLKAAEDNDLIAHACGTCRMAVTSQKGVVDPTGKVFGVENLYICDGSIFPTNVGVNPSLTIAACAMKIATEFLENKWKK